jgi:beta-phosphoglucomutase-like phosphatase (HAD superfamily)
MNTTKSWREKLAAYKDLPKVKPIPPRMRKKRGDGTIAMPSPFDVEEAMRTVPLHCLATIEQLGQRVASKHNATIGCTVTTGIFAWMIANAAHEDEVAGKPAPTPYWRAVKAGGELNAKYPGGIQDLMNRLESEGHVVVQRGKRFYVEDYDRKLVKR